jgi:hypothetical protein
MARPKYRVVGSFYHEDVMHQDGAEVDYDGTPGENLEPLNAEAKKAKERAGKVSAVQPLDSDERAELERLREENEQFKALANKA